MRARASDRAVAAASTPVKEASGSDRFAWELFLVRDKSVNAFALPGGYVGLHLGLIAMTGARDELASVLGHELSHVTQRHIARSIVGDARTSLLATAGRPERLAEHARSAPHQLDPEKESNR